MNATPNFAAVLADCRAERQSEAQRNADSIRRWTTQVDESFCAVRESGRAAYVAETICDMPNMSPADGVAILAAMFHAIAKNGSHIESRRDVLAALTDCVSQLRSEVES